MKEGILKGPCISWTYFTGAFIRFQNPKFRPHELSFAFRLWTFIMKRCPSFISVLAMTDSVLCNQTPGYGLRRICAVARLTGMSRQHLRSPIETQTPHSLSLLIRSRISRAARFVPAPPAQPRASSQRTSLGVSVAVRPTLTGRNSVLCTV